MANAGHRRACCVTWPKAARRSARPNPRHSVEEEVAMSEAAETEDLDQLSDDAFRMLVRNFIEKYYPPELRNSPRRLHYKDTKGWYRTLARKGWLCPNWPRQFGGMGISASKQLIMLEEKER